MSNVVTVVFGGIVVIASSAAAPAQWGPIVTPAAPAPRAGALAAYDLITQRTLMFGGGFGNEFWSYSSAGWTQLAPATLPGPRSRASLAANPVAGTLLLYGGIGAGSGQFGLDETWQFDGVDWQLLTPSVSPGGLARHSLAFDLTRQAFVLFGGRNNLWFPNQALAQTWEFVGGNWTLAVPAQSPPGRVDAAMSFHPALGGVLMFGGQDSASIASDETWWYDGTTWIQTNTTGPRPAPRIGAALVPVLGRSLCVLVGGRDPVTMAIFNDTWEHDGANWTQVNSVYGGVYPARADSAVAHDAMRDRLVLFGGVIANGALQDDTWEYGAYWQAFGLGCAGSAGVPSLAGGATPRLGTTATANLGNLPPSSPFAFLAIGLSRTQLALGNLPALLTSFGMPGCRTYTSADLLTAVTASGGAATWSWSVPPVSAFLGTTFYLQGVSWDPGINALGLTMSNALTLVVGG
jgi:hypothetical protein